MAYSLDWLKFEFDGEPIAGRPESYMIVIGVFDLELFLHDLSNDRADGRILDELLESEIHADMLLRFYYFCHDFSMIYIS